MATNDHIPATKACKACGGQKPLTSEFWTPQKLGKYGFTSRCRECKTAECAERRARPDQLARQQAWRDANKDRVAKYNKDYRDAGYKSTAHVNAWRAKNIERARAMERKKQRRLRDNNPEKYRLAARLRYSRRSTESIERARISASSRYRTVPWVNVGARVNNRLRKMLRGVGGKSRNRTEALVGYTMQQLVDHLEKQFTNGMTWELMLSGEIEIDHIVPVANFKVSSLDDGGLRNCWALANLRPLWKSDNRAKRDRITHLL